MSDITSLPANQVKALEALVTGCTTAEAAAVAGVTPRTVYRWRTSPDFAGALRAANTEGLHDLAHLVAVSSREAMEYLRAVVADKGIPHNTRIRAAGLITSAQPRLYEMVNLADQLEDIEHRLEAANL